MQTGLRVLIHAGAGGVGHLAVQIAKALGAHVIATASTRKIGYLKSIGVDEAIDYTNTDFAVQVRDIDIVFDAPGGDHLIQSLKTRAPAAPSFRRSIRARLQWKRSGRRT